MWDAARFWLDLGVDGFRLDAIGTIYEDPKLTAHDVPMNLAELRNFSDIAKTSDEIKLKDKYWHDMFKNQLSQPGLHDLMKELRSVLDEYDGDRMLVGEDDDIAYMGNGDDELHLVFNFPLMRTKKISPDHIRRNQQDRLTQLDALSVNGWGCNTLGNHDCPRIHNWFGDNLHDAALARLNAALVLTLKGTPFIYNGDEIGMTDLIITDPTKLRDTMASWYYERLVNELKVNPTEAALRAAEMSRDRNRTPMQWSNKPNGGFSPDEVDTWLPVNPNYKDGINVRDQLHNPDSLLNYYKQLLRVRKKNGALIEGDYVPLHEYEDRYFAFLRKSAQQTVLVILNYSENHFDLELSQLKGFEDQHLHVLFSSAVRTVAKLDPVKLHIGAFEVFIAEVK